MSDIDFGKLFNNLCEQSGKNNTEIARGLGIDKATVGRWRNGERSPKLSSLPDIADYFNVDIQIFSKKKNSQNQEEFFTDPVSALKYLLSNPGFAAFGGYDLNKMSDEELTDFANEVADYAKYIADRKYKK